ncbi:ATP-binding protein [Sphingomonas arantia]|uniref:ATP-binding protein n=1 Tax=Sphingomonas arantia TaxID=1460676 RepID=A0ABW4U2E5_9SPHN
MNDTQLSLFGFNADHAATWTPRDLWLRLDRMTVADFGEDRRIERKSGRTIRYDDLAEYYSMWSNTVDGGIMLIGVDDNGGLRGCSSLSQDQLNGIDKFHTNNCPDASPEPRRIPIEVNGKPDFLISIFIPYRGFLVETHKSEAFIRRGDQKHKMSSEERDDFRSTRHERSWELRKSGFFRYPGDFDQAIIREFANTFRERESKDDWTDEAVLIDRHLMTYENGEYHPLNSMVLFCAYDPRMQHAGCRIRVQRFDGVEEGSGSDFRPLKDFYIEGNIPAILKKAGQSIADLNHDVTWLGRDGKFVTTPEYPRWAWFEAIVNALVHRSYSFSGSEITVKFFSDRLEVESPGGFVPPVTPENVYYHRASRNPHLMEALRYLGFVRMTREGTRRMKESMESYGLPAPTFSQQTMHGVAVRVVLRNDHHTRKRSTDRDVATYCGVELWKQLAEHEVQIIGYAYNNGQIQVAEAERLTKRTWGTSKKDLTRLVDKGLLRFIAPTKLRDPKARYEIVEYRKEIPDETR